MCGRTLRTVVLLAFLLFGGGSGGASAEPLKPADLEAVQPIEVVARPIERFRSSHPTNLFGRLQFRGGLVLTSSSSLFGGWSGIVVEPDGRRMLAISDEGTWMTAEITYRGRAPSGIAHARIGPIRALRGRHLNKKRDLDAEGVALLSGSLSRGTVLVSFERNHRIGMFPMVDSQLEAPVRYLKLPPEARRMRSNSGIEAVTVLKGGSMKGSVVAFSEQFPGNAGQHTGWIWIRDVAHRMTLLDHGGFAITDAASLDDGGLVILERRFRWTEGVKMRLRLVEADAVKPGAVLDGEVLLEADLASAIDNMEGLAVHRGPDGETVLTLISDNNFNGFLQRNLLLQFALGPKRNGRGPE